MNAAIAVAKERAARGERPASDLGYCDCGNVWNIEYFNRETSYVNDTCPDCGAAPVYVEKAADLENS